MIEKQDKFTCIRESKRILTPLGSVEVLRLTERGYASIDIAEKLRVPPSAVGNVIRRDKKDVPAVKGMHPALMLGFTAQHQ